MTNKFYPARRVQSLDELTRAGDYCGPEPLENGGRTVRYLLPIHQGVDKHDHTLRGSGLHAAYEPPWNFVEHPDGSLEIQGSIACGRNTPEGQYWHGYLRAGNQWEELPN